MTGWTSWDYGRQQGVRVAVNHDAFDVEGIAASGAFVPKLRTRS